MASSSAITSDESFNILCVIPSGLGAFPGVRFVGQFLNTCVIWVVCIGGKFCRAGCSSNAVS